MELKFMNLYSETHNDKFKEITKNWKPEGVEITRYDNEGKTCLRIREPDLSDEMIAELSATYPEVRFIAHCFYDDDGHEVEQVFGVKEGQIEAIREIVTYLWCLGPIQSEMKIAHDLIELTDKNVLAHLLRNAEEVFRRIDSVVGPDGSICARVYKPEVIITATYGDWEIKANKCGPFILGVMITKDRGDGTIEYYSPLNLLTDAFGGTEDSQKPSEEGNSKLRRIL